MIDSGNSLQIDFMPVAGESFGKRQNRIKKLKPGNTIVLKRDRNNEHDRNAIALYSTHGDVGFIPRDNNQKLARYMDEGGKLYGWVRKVVGGTKQKPDRGLIITISSDGDYFRSIIDDIVADGVAIEDIVIPAPPKPWLIEFLQFIWPYALMGWLGWVLFY